MMDDPIKKGNELVPDDTADSNKLSGSKMEDGNKGVEGAKTEGPEKVKKSVTLADAPTIVGSINPEENPDQAKGKKKKGKGGKSKKKKGRKKKKKRNCTVKRRKKAIKPRCEDMLEETAMENLYWIVHNAPDAIKSRKFKWKKKK